jgi:hypothetical protein
MDFGWSASSRVSGREWEDACEATKKNVRRRTPVDLSAEARRAKADVAQLAEHVLGKDEVTSSILVIGSRNG